MTAIEELLTAMQESESPDARDCLEEIRASTALVSSPRLGTLTVKEAKETYAIRSESLRVAGRKSNLPEVLNLLGCGSSATVVDGAVPIT